MDSQYHSFRTVRRLNTWFIGIRIVVVHQTYNREVSMSTIYRAIGICITILSLIAISGCSSIVSERMATINVQAPGCPPGTICTLTHKKGSWDMQPPGTITIPKSDDLLRVQCRTPDGKQIYQTLNSEFGGMFWGNIIFGGGIGMIVDADTDAHREYPASIVISGC